MLREYFGHTPQLLFKVFDFFWSKFVISFLAAPFFLFDSLKKDAMIALLILIFFDFISALVAASKTGEQIRSKKVFRSAYKVLIYSMMVSAGHLVNLTHITPVAVSISVDGLIISYLAITELISILENMKKGGFSVPTQVIDWAKEKIKERQKGEESEKEEK